MLMWLLFKYGKETTSTMLGQKSTMMTGNTPQVGAKSPPNCGKKIYLITFFYLTKLT